MPPRANPLPLAPSRSSQLAPLLCGLLILIALFHAVLAVCAMRSKSTTSDEMAHLVGGYTFNHWNDYRLHPENGILPQRWQALPATLAHVTYPTLESRYWRESDVWMIGHAYFYELGNDLDWLLFSARAMNAVFGAATVLLVGWWARRLFGWTGALIAAAFCALCPTMLAHSALATSDMAMTFLLLASGTAYWMHLHDGRARLWWLSAGVFGLACVAKYTAVLLLPLFALLGLCRIFTAEPLPVLGRTATTRWARLGVVLASILWHGLVATAIIWGFFGFRYAAMNPALLGGDFTIPWVAILYGGGWKADIVQFCRNWQLLPEGFLYGFAFVLKHAGQRGAFLDGEYSIYGWVEFFPKTFLYKTPPSLLVSVALSTLFVGLRSLRRTRQLLQQLYRFAPVALMFLLYWAVSLPSHLNIGHRHILPVYPLVFIVTGALGWASVRSWQKSRPAGLTLGALICLLVGWQALAAARIHPHYLAYFSPAAGGPEQGYHHLVDSSLDWGQDLPGLKRWLEQNRGPGEALYLSYFGTGEPAYYGIEAIRMPTLHNFEHAAPWYWPEPGLYAISATMLQHVYSGIRGPWTAELEHRYQMLRANNANFRLIQKQAPGCEQLLATTSRQEWETAWRLYEELRFARLCHYLSARPPDAQIGFSIMVYRVSPDELTLALDESASNLVRAIRRMSGPGGIKP